MRRRTLAPAVAALLAVALAACGDTLVDHRAIDLQRGPGGGVCSGDAPVSCSVGGADVCKLEGPEFCGTSCTDCTAAVPAPPTGGVAACLPGAAPGGGACGYACTGGLLKCTEGCCPAASLAIGEGHTCAVTSGGALYCWGGNDGGQVSGAPSSAPVTTPLKRFDAGVVAVAAGVVHTCAAFAGEVRCWGRYLEGALPEARSVAGVVDLAAGASHSCALVGSTGAVTCWGSALAGQNGGGTPIASGARALAAGANHTCALMSTGAVRCWGSRAKGQLGDGSITGFSTTPVTAIASGVTAIAASGDHTCAASSDAANALRCWGDAPGPVFGLDPAQAAPAVPLEEPGKAVIEFTIALVATGKSHVCVRKGGAAETVKCFGPEAGKGELGGAPAAATETVDVPSSAGATVVAAGGDHACAILPGGAVRCWGSNAAGQLGDGTTTTPGLGGDPQPLGTPLAVSGR